MMQDWCSAVAGGVRLAVQVVPNASRSEVAGAVEGALRIRLKAQPVEGKANEALLRYLADHLGVPKSTVHITHGHSSRRKTVRIDAPHLSAAEVRLKLLPQGK
jgi:hypothetical protein